MHGVPANLNLDFLRGAKLTQVCLGEHQIQLLFETAGSISIEGDWEFVAADCLQRQQVDKVYQNDSRLLPQLIGQHVVATAVLPPRSFSVQFDSGALLTVFDSSKQYESFTIQPGDIVV